jgi:thiamine-phosphate pyrophosphorylase
MSIQGLYAIADCAVIDKEMMVDRVLHAITGGARVIQYRAKNISKVRQAEDAKTLAALCKQHNVLFIVNDNPQLARQVNADGVHIGQDDTSISNTRAIVGDEMIIGYSCYNDLHRAQSAENEGADYVAFGSFFPSKIKPDAVRAPLTLLSEARSSISLPLVAIGGINATNGRQLIEAGANALAVISEIFAAEDVTSAARQFSSLFNSPNSQISENRLKK